VDDLDNCPAVFNIDQADDDGMGPGNACDLDFFRGLIAVDDINGNSSPEFVVAHRDITTGDGRFNSVGVYDGMTGQLLSNYNYFGVENRRPDGLLSWTLDSSQSVALSSTGFQGLDLSEQTTSSFPGVQARDPVNGNVIVNLFPWNSNWTVKQSIVSTDASFGGEAVLITLAESKLSGLMAVEIQGTASKAVLTRQYPLGFGWTPVSMQMVKVQNEPAVAVLATRNLDGLTVIQVRRTSDNSLVRNVYPLGLGWSPVAFRTVPDLNANGSDEVAVLMVRDSDGLTLIQVRDSETNQLVANVYPIGAGQSDWQVRQFEVVSSNQNTLFAIVTTRATDSQILVQMKNPLTNEVVKNNFFLGPPWQLREKMVVVPDYTQNNSDELAVPAQNSNTGERLIQVRDAIDGGLLINIRPTR
ncbi:MAG: hypothetical protein AAF438_00300, partial [Pseudomonadota bacterium]